MIDLKKFPNPFLINCVDSFLGSHMVVLCLEKSRCDGD